MPRGRFISKSFYDNDRLNDMPIEVHHLFGGLIIVCADVDGRLKGQVKWINQLVFSERDYTDKQVDEWLNILEAAKDAKTGEGLIERYSKNGKQYIQITGFDVHQRGRDRRHEAESKIPPMDGSVTAADKPVTAGKPTEDLKIAGMIKYYEDEIGRTLTPTDLERLKDFADNYPDGWFEKAVDEAKNANARSPMRYIEKVMENWLKADKPDDEDSADNQGITSI